MRHINGRQEEKLWAIVFLSLVILYCLTPFGFLIFGFSQSVFASDEGERREEVEGGSL